MNNWCYCPLLLLLACDPPKQRIIIHTADIANYSTANAAYIPEKILTLANNATVYLETPKTSCSGTLVQTKGANKKNKVQVLTSAHCFLETDCNTVRTYLIDKQSKHFACQQGTLRLHHDSDLALYSLQGKLPATNKPLTVWQGKLPKLRSAFIIHYAGGNKSVTGIDCYVLGNFDLFFWLISPLFLYGLSHTCSILPGSSGAGLLDFETGKLLGVVWGDAVLSSNEELRQYSGAIHYLYVQKFIKGETLTTPWWWFLD